LSTRPKILLLDEVAAGLTEIEVEEMARLIRRLRDELDLSVIWIEHAVKILLKHVERVIVPALERGAVVLSDRFHDSTRAYQGAGGGASPDLIAALETYCLGSVRPDLTLIMDLPVAVGLARAMGRGGAEARFESKGEAFHEKLRQGFADIAAAEPERCRLINADQTPDALEALIWDLVQPALAARS